ncbi:DUF6308 family protein [Euzebya pacifica]|uniref:DUF6308 family protein n=1 Tax=Euzebya pacifica TaxID=1608957 RepID=UPI000DF727C8|nr:DUF6308 family protein [Euzebya pacifica]
MMNTGFADELEARLLQNRAANDLQRYFGGGWTGGFWDRAVAALPSDAIGVADAAVSQLLAIGVTPKGGRGRVGTHGLTQLLELDGQIEELLSQIPVDRDLHTLTEEEFAKWVGDRDAPNGLANQLFELVRRQLHPKEDRAVATYKLLAAKRPRLLPIRDTKVARLLTGKAAPKWYRPLWTAFRERQGIVARLEDLHEELGRKDVSLLRIADVVLWMQATEPDANATCLDHDWVEHRQS